MKINHKTKMRLAHMLRLYKEWLVDGKVISIDGDELAIDVEIYMLDENGEVVPCPNGTYVIEDNNVTVEAGKITAIEAIEKPVEEQPVEEPAVEENMATDEPENEEPENNENEPDEKDAKIAELEQKIADLTKENEELKAKIGEYEEKAKETEESVEDEDKKDENKFKKQSRKDALIARMLSKE